MKQNKTIPILLKEPKILLIGGGAVALQKAEVLQHNNIDFFIISEMLNEKIVKTTKNIQQKTFKIKDIKDFYIIIDATGVPLVAKKLLKYKKKHNILLNIVDVPEFCDFYFMALTQNKPLQIAVSSNGASPTAAKFFRDECEKLIPKNISKYLRKKQKQRDKGIIKINKTKNELIVQKDSLLK
ncbi:MAG: uroporphyrin-III C-methyltransferase/precorrin-2 dehydrogenase/sirohydrochlorin ferrochelatase [Arcobacteraceae bacterium]|jgi:uroporphyrin-III C-methyltransferase/precorrin-2 dehydrogenase/sirohydrochlorin ferrochelatase